MRRPLLLAGRFGLTALLLVAAGGCGRPRRAVVAPQIAIRPVSSEPVVATVNGSPILASDVAAQRRSGQSREQAVRALVREELLVQEAARRGLDRHREVIDAQRRAMAELLVRKRFRDELGPDQIPRRLVEESYRRNRTHFVHPELVEVSHILCQTSKDQAAAVHESARRLAARVHALAAARPLTAEQFLAIVGQVKPEAGSIELRGETLTTPRRGFTVEPFAAAAFALSRPGAISPVTETSFGYHVIYLRRRTPAINQSIEQAQREIRSRILEEARAELLSEFIDKLEKTRGVRLMPENLPRGAGEAAP